MKNILIIFILLQTILFAQTDSLERVKLQLQWKHQFQFAGFIMAKELGYYEDVGLDVELIEYDNTNITKDLEEQKIDYALTNSIISYHDKKLRDVTLAATYFQRSPLILITQREIKSVLDLKNKKIMMSNDNRYNSSLSILLDYFNINSQNNTIIKPSFNIEDFIQKKVDVITGFRSNELYILDKRNIPYNIIDPVEHGFSTNAINLFVSQEKAKNNPQQIKNFLSATKKGWEYALANIGETAGLIHLKYQPNKSIEHLVYEGKVTKDLMLLNLYDIGAVNEEFVLKTYAQLVRNDKLDRNQTPNNLIFKEPKKAKIQESKIHLSDIEKEWLKNNKHISFTGDPNWLPYEAFDKNGNYIGIVSEHLKIIEGKSGLKFKPLHVFTWSEALTKATNGDVKVISGDSSDVILNKNFRSVDSYSQNPIVIIMDIKNNYVEKLEFIKNKKIALIKDYGYTADIFKKYPYIKFIEVQNIQDGLSGISEGKYDAMLATNTLASYTIAEMGLHNLKIVGKTPIMMNLTLFVSKDEPILWSIVNKSINSITQEEKHNILQKWVKHKYVEKIDTTLAISIALSMLTIIFFILLWSFKMKQEIKKRTIIQNAYKAERDKNELYLDTAQILIVALDAQARVTMLNKKAEELLEYTEDELLGKVWFEIGVLPEDIAENVSNFFDTLMSMTELSHEPFEHSLISKSGKEIILSFRSSLLFDENNKVIGILSSGSDITKRLKSEKLLKETNEKLSVLYKLSPIGIALTDMQGNYIEFNEAFSSITGYTFDELEHLDYWALTPKKYYDDEQKQLELLNSTGFYGPYEKEYINKNGGVVPINLNGMLITNSDDGKKYIWSLVEDITERKNSQKELQKQHDFLQTIINSVSSGIMVIYKDYSVPLMNDTAREMIDESIILDPLSPKCHEISHHDKNPCDSIMHPCPLQKVLDTKAGTKVVHNHSTKSGKTKIVELTASPLHDDNGEIIGIIESAHDITELTQTQNELKHQAEHDFLTSLPNRVLFLDRLKQSIKHSARYKENIAVLFIDLDNFKDVNDSLGHGIGDILLKTVSTKLKGCLRQSDTVARLGGDEFAISIDHFHNIEVVTSVVQTIMETFKEPLQIENHQIYVTLSLGISIYPEDGNDSTTLIKNADTAMYKAKQNGRNNYQFYTPDMTEKALERIVLETQLRQSIVNNELEVYYQLQINAKDESIIGMEALVRWNHPEVGLISPAKFIPIAEENGFIIDIDEWVMKKSITQFKSWYEKGLNPGMLSLNLAVLRLEQDGFIEKIKNMIESSDIKAEWLSFEVTETKIMQNPEKSINNLNELNKLGIKLSIDDFGTGYSSLSYLKKLPINKLKIDQSFVRDIPGDLDDVEITKTIIAMAKNLNLSIIAEGVETKEQKDFLIDNDCCDIQGYLYHKPSPASEVEKKLL